MRWTSALGTAGLAELAAHLLSLGWGFAVITGAFVVVAVRMTSAVAGVKAKAQGTEARLGAHIVAAAPAISFVANGGTVGGSVVVAGDHHINGTLYGVSGGLSVGDQINGTNVSLSGGQTDYGHTTHGTVNADNNIIAGSDLHAGGWVYSTDLQVNGQRIAPGQGQPAGYPYVGGTIANVDNGMNAIVGGLLAAGMFA